MAKLETLVDPFTGPSLSGSWADDSTGTGNQTVTGGSLQCNGGSVNGDSGGIVLTGLYGGTNSFDIGNSYGFLSFTTNAAQYITYVFLIDVNIHGYAITITDGTTLAFQRLNAGVATALSSSTYNATTHKWFRFREDGTKMHLETSADPSISWTDRFNENTNTNPSFNKAAVGPAFGIEYNGTANPIGVFDNFNVIQSSGSVQTPSGSVVPMLLMFYGGAGSLQR